MKTKIYITRHGETQWNLEGKLQGWKNSDLTPRGVQQAELLRKKIEQIKLDRIYSSPTLRAFNTADIIRGVSNIEIVCADELREMNLGEWEGRYTAEIKEKDPERYNAFYNEPKLYKHTTGESFEELALRVQKKMKDIGESDKGKSVLIVSHGITINMILLIIKKKSIEALWDTPMVKQTSLICLEYEGGEFKMILEPNTLHLEDGIA